MFLDFFYNYKLRYIYITGCYVIRCSCCASWRCEQLHWKGLADLCHKYGQTKVWSGTKTRKKCANYWKGCRKSLPERTLAEVVHAFLPSISYFQSMKNPHLRGAVQFCLVFKCTGIGDPVWFVAVWIKSCSPQTFRTNKPSIRKRKKTRIKQIAVWFSWDQLLILKPSKISYVDIVWYCDPLNIIYPLVI